MGGPVFLFAIHNHQPVGNFPWVFEKAFKDCYFPFLKEMEKHPGINFTLHFSGPLWENMKEKEKHCFEIVSKMVERQQVELLGGGFYEPILSIIPEADRLGQIELMNQFLEKNFKVRPSGLWLAERVWEPNLPKTLAKCGIRYSLLDEEHFHYAGIKNIHTYYITEEEGYPLNIFPIDKKLRYLVPFRTLEEIEAYFQDIEKKGGVAILGDDGEKFGLWPGTKKWVYEEGWLRKFLDFLEARHMRSLTCSEFLAEYPPGGRIYLPPASYEEMMEWVLEPEDYEVFKKLKDGSPQEAKRFLRGGFFREFFLKYPETNHLHKRMLLVSREVNHQQKEKAKISLYKAQSNDPYWHGIFGGLYLPHLREAAYSHLLEAEKALSLKTGWKEIDYDLDGKKEIFHRGQKFNLFIKPSFGGSIIEFDYKPLSRNLTDVLSRRKESYHAVREEGKGEGKSIHELTKELPPEAKDLLRYDWYPRYSLLDHFFHPETKKEDFERFEFGEQGDFVNQEYEFSLEGNKLLLQRQGNVWVDGERISLRVKKEILTDSNYVNVNYEIENLSVKKVDLFFGSEWNFYLLPEELEIHKHNLLLLGGRLSFQPSHPLEIWHFPLQTLSQSERGYDIIQQGICFVPLWKMTFSGQEKFTLFISIKEKDDR